MFCKAIKKLFIFTVYLTYFSVVYASEPLNENKDFQSNKFHSKRKFDRGDVSEENNDSYVLTKKIRKNEEDIIVEEKASDYEIYVAQILSEDLDDPSKIEHTELTISKVTNIFLKDTDNEKNKQIELLKSLLEKPISLIGNKNRIYNDSKTSKKIENIFTVTFENAGNIFEAPYEFLITLLSSDDQELIDKTCKTLQGYYTYNKEKNINRFKKRILVYALDRQSLSFTDELRKKILKFNNTLLDLSHDDKFKIFHTINGDVSKSKQKKDKLQSTTVQSSPTKIVSFYEFKVEPVIEIDLGSDSEIEIDLGSDIEEVIAINNNNVMPQFPVVQTNNNNNIVSQFPVTQMTINNNVMLQFPVTQMTINNNVMLQFPVTQMTINNNVMPQFYVPQILPDQSFSEKYSDPILWVCMYLGMPNVKDAFLNAKLYLMTRFFKICGEDRIRQLTEDEVYQAMLWVQILMPDLFRNQRV